MFEKFTFYEYGRLVDAASSAKLPWQDSVASLNNNPGYKARKSLPDSLDTPEQISKCLSCQLEECINCHSGSYANTVKRHIAARARDKQIVAYFNEGLTVREILKKMEIGRGTYYKALKHHGITP